MNIDDMDFNGINYSNVALELAHYDNCSFIDCNFSNAELTGRKFEECRFTNCNFTMSKVQNTSFRSVVFFNCKILGVQFNDCNEFLLSFNFEDCLLNLSSFYGLSIINTIFKACSMEEVDFSNTDLSQSSFNDCDLNRSIFNRSNLIACDFRSAHNYIIDPENNRIQKAKFSIFGLPGLLLKYNLIIES